MMLAKPSVSMVVPVCNSAGSLPDLVNRLENALLDTSADFEVVLVNHGSQDRSWDAICHIAQERKWVRGIGLRRNADYRRYPWVISAGRT